MVSMLWAALQIRGLSLHPSKCKAQTNIVGWQRRGQIPTEEGFSIEVLPEGEGLKILGTVLTLRDATPTEMQNRLAVGWKMFWAMKRILVNRKISLRKRLKLFDSTVGSCVLWCAQSWTPRVEELRALEAGQRAMLRRMLGPSRAEGEPWVDWIRRVTRKVVALAAECNVRRWTVAHAMAKWSWAGHVARRPVSTWLWNATVWRDSEWNLLASDLGAARPLRPWRRRWMKWEDALRRYCAAQGINSWKVLASDREAWKNHTGVFASWLVAA